MLESGETFISCNEIQNGRNFGSLYAKEKEINENMWMQRCLCNIEQVC